MDFLLAEHGSIYLLTARTPEAQAWVASNLPEDRLRWAGATAIGHQYVSDIITGIGQAGLQVELS
jgi:hypothetical protein